MILTVAGKLTDPSWLSSWRSSLKSFGGYSSVSTVRRVSLASTNVAVTCVRI